MALARAGARSSSSLRPPSTSSSPPQIASSHSSSPLAAPTGKQKAPFPTEEADRSWGGKTGVIINLRMSKFMQGAWDEVQRAGDLSAWGRDSSAANASHQELVKDSLQKKLSESEPVSVSRHFSAWAKWKKFVGEKSRASTGSPWVFAPPPWLIGSFLKISSSTGPTAARGMAAHLDWMARLLGLDLNLKHPLVNPMTVQPRSHVPSQAIPLEARMVVHLELIAKQGNQFLCHAAADSILMTFGVVRWAHIQRSRLVGQTNANFTFLCVKGKTWGKPFLWTLGVSTFTGIGAAAAVVKTLRSSPDEHSRPFLLRAWGPCARDPTTASKWLPRQLTFAQASAARRKLLQLHPLNMSLEQAKAFSSYSARRVLPTIGGMLSMRPSEMAALSNWRDVTAQDAQASKVARSTPAHYDASKLLQSARAKSTATLAVTLAAEKSSKGLNADWQELAQHFPQAIEARKAARDSADVFSPQASHVQAKRSWPFLPSQLATVKRFRRLKGASRAEKARVPSRNEHLSQSASSSSQGGWAPDSAPHHPWFHAAHSKGPIHWEASTSTDVVTAKCGKKVSLSSAVRGVSEQTALTAGRLWCKYCYKGS